MANCRAPDCRNRLTIAGDNDAEQAHDQERAHPRQIALGRVAVEAKRAEGRRRHEEHLRDRGRRVAQEDRGERGAHHGCEQPEHQLRRAEAHLVDAPGEEEDEAQGRQRDDPHERRRKQRLSERGQIHAPMQREHAAARTRGQRRVGGHGIGEDDVGNNARQGHAGGHVVVDAQHVCAQTFVYGDVGARTHASLRIPVVVLSHLVLPFDFSPISGSKMRCLAHN